MRQQRAATQTPLRNAGQPHRRALAWRQAGTLCLLLGLLLAGLSQEPVPLAQAGGDFCEPDPLVLIDGSVVHIQVGVPWASLSQITASNPVQIQVLVPSNSKTRYLTATGSNRFPEQLVFVPSLPAATGPVEQIQVAVTAPAQGAQSRYPVRLTLTSPIDSQVTYGTSGTSFGTSRLVPRNSQ